MFDVDSQLFVFSVTWWTLTVAKGWEIPSKLGKSEKNSELFNQNLLDSMQSSDGAFK